MTTATPIAPLSHAAPTGDDARRARELLAARSAPNEAFFTANADRIARLCERMAERFLAGGRLVAIGCAPAAQSDVRHVTVEFVHPVIVGKRALPAIGLAGAGDDVRVQLALLARPDDIVIAFGAPDGGDPANDALRAAVHVARARGCLTVAQSPLGAEVELIAPAGDPFVAQEVTETLYHVLWELVHVFIEHAARNPATSRDAQTAHAATFLYPFLADAPSDREELLRDTARSAVTKARDVDALRRATLDDAAIAMLAASAALTRERLAAGACVLAFGNGGSATDAMDLVADLRAPPAAAGILLEHAALDLTVDSAIVTALGNDVGHDVVFRRQIIAYARGGDVAVGFSTSGSSRNVIAALEEARGRGLSTLAFVGYDGGRILSEHAADFVIVAPSQYVPRIQEAHATAYHVWRSLLG